MVSVVEYSKFSGLCEGVLFNMIMKVVLMLEVTFELESTS